VSPAHLCRHRHSRRRGLSLVGERAPLRLPHPINSNICKHVENQLSYLVSQWRTTGAPPPASTTGIAVHQAQSSGSNPLIAVRAGQPGRMFRDVPAKIWTNMSWANIGWASSAHETGTWEYRRARCVAPAKKRCAPVPGKRALQAHDIEPCAV
jgi:hypothetical protein